jgi:hypothetical protein
MPTEQATAAEIGLTPEQKKTLLRLFELQMSLPATVRELEAQTGRLISLATAKKYKDRHRSQTYRDTIDHRRKGQSRS